ncbi:MAG: ATP-binding protein [Desulfobacterales bacterium]|jgi:signal transduction histidine kinase|nr:ATP-binding protein [Desulfobacterales bacterium]
MTLKAPTRDETAAEVARLRAENRRLESLVRKNETALRQVEQQLQQAQKMETLGTLVAGVAHEINNPINLIIYNLPLLQKIWADLLPALIRPPAGGAERKYGGFTVDFLKDNLPRLIGDMDLAANRVTKIVADLKNFSRQSNVAEKHPFSINAAVTNALRLAKPTLRRAGIRVATELAPDLPQVEGSLQSLEQVVLNIIVNGVQAIEHAAGEIRIKTTIDRKEGRVRLQVADNGRGVSPAIAARVFLPFVTDKQDRGGTGLGLSVSYGIVKAHGGEIFFETQPGEGTTFTILLPTLLKRHAAKILVVDDDRMVRQVMVEALSLSRCYLVEEAANGIEASIRLGTYRPDLLILDVFMPEMDGLEVCRSIRTEPELAGMNVIITTGYPGHPKLDELADLGFTHVLAKPFNIPELLHTVSTLLGDR